MELGVEPDPIGCEGGGHVGYYELVVAVGFYPVWVGQLVFVEVDDRGDVADAFVD